MKVILPCTQTSIWACRHQFAQLGAAERQNRALQSASLPQGRQCSEAAGGRGPKLCSSLSQREADLPVEAKGWAQVLPARGGNTNMETGGPAGKNVDRREVGLLQAQAVELAQ